MIHILTTCLNLEHEALEIYLSGCKQHCPGCHNPETHGFGKGQRWERWLKDNAYKLKHTNGLFRRIWIMGGEPLDQLPVDLNELCHSLSRTNPALELWLWTSRELSDVPDTLRRYLHFVKTGRYLRDLPAHDVGSVLGTDGTPFRLASSNQQLHRIKA